MAVITGANSGIGFQAARILARKGAQVVMAVRNKVKRDKAAREIRSAVPEADIEVLALDLASLASIRAFADAFRIAWRLGSGKYSLGITGQG